MKKILAVCLLALGLAGCTNYNHFTKMDPAEPLRHGRLSLQISDGWARATQINAFETGGRFAAVRYMRLDAPTVAMEMEVRSVLDVQNELKRRGETLQIRELGESIRVGHVRFLAIKGSMVTNSSLELVDFAKHPGFKITMDFVAYNGLEMKAVIYGAVHQDYIHWVIYEADTVNNFDRFLPAFMDSIKKAKIEDRACSLGYLCV